MIAELVAILVCTAASSYVTYALVARHASARFVLLSQQLKLEATGLKAHAEVNTLKLADTITTKLEELKKTHVETIAKHVELEVKNTAGATIAKVCNFCGKSVVAFEKIEGKIRCVNCKNEGR
jgi:hypothetical protein